MHSNIKEDVDRLFSCFKCGTSTPQSALPLGKKRGSAAMCATLQSIKHYPKLLKGGLQADKPGETTSLPSKETRGRSSERLQLCTGKVEAIFRRERPDTSTINVNGRNEISPIVFYGSPNGVPPKRPSHLLRLLQEIRIDLAEERKLNFREEVWVTFPKQNQAIAFAKSHGYAHVFSYQDHLNGQRRFLASTYEEFWRRYHGMDPMFRHHYEVIQEGLPCHLYFDLEFDKTINLAKNGDEMVELLIMVTFKVLYEKYNIQADLGDVIELDSSTQGKFSRHLIIHIPGAAFKDNSHMGLFVSEICSQIHNSRIRDPNLEKLYVLKNSSVEKLPSQLFLDMAVYSRNRCFRLALSSKAGKKSVLQPSGRFKCKNMDKKEVFMESLICRVDANCKRLLICKNDLECMKTLYFDSEVNDDYNYGRRINDVLLSRGHLESYMMGTSLFPSLDNFIESIASTGNITGRIRSWYWFSELNLMVYNMSRNRFCERIGREHKSNHVMYIVDLRRCGYYQKCYDPDCRGYRSPLRPVPLDVIPDNFYVLNIIRKQHDHEIFSPASMICGHGDDDGDDMWLTKSCKKDTGWWLEATRLAEDIEHRMSQTCSTLDGFDSFEDCKWSTDAEKIISALEQYS